MHHIYMKIQEEEPLTPWVTLRGEILPVLKEDPLNLLSQNPYEVQDVEENSQYEGLEVAIWETWQERTR